MSCPRKALVGPWGHTYAWLGGPGPALDWAYEEVRWWSHWLRGAATGLGALGVGGRETAVTALFGFFNGLLVTRIKLPPFIVTLGTFSLFRGLAEGLTHAMSDDEFNAAIELLTQQVDNGQIRQVTGNDYIAALSVFASYGYVVAAPFHGDTRFTDLKVDDLEDFFQVVNEVAKFFLAQVA